MTETERWEKIAELLARLSDKKRRACWLLAQGSSQQQVADTLGCSQPYISKLKNEDVEFRESLDALTCYVSWATAGERLRLAYRAINQLIEDDGLNLRGTDLLEWLNYVGRLQGEGDEALRVKVEGVEWTPPKTMAELLEELDDKV